MDQVPANLNTLSLKSWQALRKICKNTGFLWPVFAILRISSYSVRMRENTDQKKLRIWTHFTQWIFDSILLRVNTGQGKLVFWYILGSEPCGKLMKSLFQNHKRSIYFFYNCCLKYSLFNLQKTHRFSCILDKIANIFLFSGACTDRWPRSIPLDFYHIQSLYLMKVKQNLLGLVVTFENLSG